MAAGAAAGEGWRLPRGRVLLGYSQLGDVVPGEAGLDFAPGWNLAAEAELGWTAGRFWAAAAPRYRGRLGSAGVEFDQDPEAALAWPGWTIPTGRAEVGAARRSRGTGRLDLPRGIVGVQLGNWALDAGVSPRRTGPGVFGTLALDDNGKSFPAVTARRTAAFRWRGPIRRLAPTDLLLRTGSLSERVVRYRDERGRHSWRTRPWFFQWLLGWEITSWFRLAAEHSALAAAQDGTLWLDVPQINFPLKGTTWSESVGGPVTDRIFNYQMEFRWGKAPLPGLPSEAGRAWWQYGGTDFLPAGPGGLIPEISAPASVAGVELLGRRWDLVLEYAELFHDVILWYSNGGFPEGYSQDGTLLGHSLGGSGEAFTAQVRFRLPDRALQTSLTVDHRTWGLAESTPGTGSRETVACRLGRTARAGETLRGAELGVEWFRESFDSLVSGAATSPSERDWWRVLVAWPLSLR